MAQLDDDFDGQEDLNNPFTNDNSKKDNKFVSPPNTNFGPNYEQEQDDDDEEEDDDLNDSKYKKPPKRIKELDDSGDELEENEKILQAQFKQNFNNLFADKRGLVDQDTDMVVQEEIASKEYNKEHGEQKMEPFNLREERGEGYFDQFLNYHKTKNKETDPWWKLLDEDKEKDEGLFNKKYQLSDDIIQKHKEEYDKYENSKTEINLLNEWKSLLPLFENNTQTITEAMQSLSKVIKKHDNQSNNNNKRPTKKRKLNHNETSNLYKTEENDNMKMLNKPKRKKRKRAWEVESDDENKDENGENDKISARELMGYKRKFELFSEKATMLIANGDHNIYQQTRDALIQRIKLVEDEQLFKRQQREAIELKRRIEQQQKQKAMQQQLQNKPKSEKEKLDDMLADFDDNDDNEDDDDDVDMKQDNDTKSNQEEKLVMNDKDLIWSYYWKHDENETIHGPFSCKQMSDWNDLYFKTQPIMFKNKNDNKWLASDNVNLIEKLETFSSSNK